MFGGYAPPRVYLINRACDNDRLCNALRQLREVGLSRCVVRVDAVDSDEARLNRHRLTTRHLAEYIERFPRDAHVMVDGRIPMSWSGVAHAASHGEVWSLIQCDAQPAIVFEDSVSVTDREGFLHALHQAQQCLAERSDDNTPAVCLMGSDAYTHLEVIRGDVFRLSGIFGGTLCYLINPSAARILSTNCFPMTYTLPTVMSRLSTFECEHHVEMSIVDTELSGIERDGRFLPSVQVLIDDEISAQYVHDLLPIGEALARRIVGFLPAIAEACVRCEFPYSVCRCA